MRVGAGFDAISDLVAGWGGRVVAIGQAQDDGRDRFALARFDRARRARPDVRRRRVADRADLRALRLRRGRHAAARRAHRRRRRLGPVLGRREPPLQRRAGRLQRRREPRRGCARSAPPTRTPTPPSRCPTGACSRPAWRRSAAATRAWRSCARARRARPTRRGTATAPRSSAPATARWRPTSCSSRAAARSPPGTRATAARGTPSCSPASTPPGCLDRGFGGQGVVLTGFPGATVARATALARQADGKLVAAGIACASGSGPQCGGGTARLALARYQGGDAAGPPGANGVLPTPAAPRAAAPFVSLPARLSARRGRVKVRVRCLQADALPRQAQPAAAADEAVARCCSARARSRSAAGARRRSRVKLRRKRLGTRSAGCGCGSSSRAATRPARGAR